MPEEPLEPSEEFGEDNPSQPLNENEILVRVTQIDPNLFEGLPEERVKQIVARVATVTRGYSVSYSHTHMGPLPAPETLAGYNTVVTGGAERIFKEFEAQSAHRRDIEKRVVVCDNTLSVTGQIIAFIICLLFGGAGVYLIVNGFQWAGTILASFDLVGLASAFIIGKYYQKKGSD